MKLISMGWLYSSALLPQAYMKGMMKCQQLLLLLFQWTVHNLCLVEPGYWKVTINLAFLDLEMVIGQDLLMEGKTGWFLLTESFK